MRPPGSLLSSILVLAAAGASGAFGGCDAIQDPAGEIGHEASCLIVRPGGGEMCNGADDDCDGVVDEDATCDLGSVCVAGRCQPTVIDPVCGDGKREAGEGCDDGNTDDGDDCNAQCHPSGVCKDTCATANDGVCDDGGAGAASDACAYGSDCGDCSPRRVDPCEELPAGGACLGDGVARCLGGTPTVDACAAGKTCAVDPDSLEARCVSASADKCTTGESRCAGDALLTCDQDGRWQRTPCDGACGAFALGDHCPAPATSPTVRGALRYEARSVNGAMSGWGPKFVTGLPGATLVAYRWREDLGVYQVMDTAVSGADGSFALRVPAQPGPSDRLIIWLARFDERGRAAYAVANPSFLETGRHTVADVVQNEGAQVWSFALPLADVVGEPEILLDEASHAGTARVFDHVRYVWETTSEVFGEAGDPLVVWMQPDVAWDCGACSARAEVHVGDLSFSSDIWFGIDDDQAYWSDATVVHELGHWVMDSYGTSPREGGRHFLGHTTMPGQAWSEGFATFFSSLARGDERFFSKRNGSFFWFDLDEHGADNDAVLPTDDAVGFPYQDDPVLQRMDENFVASAAYSLALALRGPDASRAPSLDREGRLFMEALASDRMNVTRLDREATFPRRYVRHTWQLNDDREITNATPIWSASAPMLADYIDAIRCESATRGQNLDREIAEVILSYPYPIAEAAICE